MTVIGRRRVDHVSGTYGVDVNDEESRGRLVQHVEGRSHKA